MYSRGLHMTRNGRRNKVILSEFDGVERVEKPVQPRHVVAAVPRIVGTA